MPNSPPFSAVYVLYHVSTSVASLSSPSSRTFEHVEAELDNHKSVNSSEYGDLTKLAPSKFVKAHLLADGNEVGAQRRLRIAAKSGTTKIGGARP